MKNSFFLSLLCVVLISACGGSGELVELTPEQIVELRIDSVRTLQTEAIERADAAEASLLSANSRTHFQDAFLESFNGSADKINQLSEALSDTAQWRPQEEVRSVLETLNHVTTANFFLVTKFGGEIPLGLDLQSLEADTRTMESAIRVLKQSFETVRRAAVKIKTPELSKEISLYGDMKGPKSKAMMIILDHMNEHQGQLIAYARVVGITPPWSVVQEEVKEPEAEQ